MKQQHHPIDNKSYEKGINSDTNKEILGPNQSGEHVDALNMRSTPMDGDNFAKKKIKGEELLYDLVDNRCNPSPPITLSDNYECMMSQEVNGNIIEVWASSVIGQEPFMRINGKIVLYSADFPVSISYPLQYDKNESCIGGEIYITNNNTPPMVFSVKDLMDNSGMTPGSECTEKYFSEFNIDAYTIQTSAILYKPAFIKQVVGSTGYDFVAGSAGLCVGSYSYSYRLVDQQGERTAFSPITELIPVVRVNSSQTLNSYPHQRTFSSEPDILSSTPYGNHIRIRYQNDVNLKFLELRRDSWYAGDAIDTPPISEIIASIPINAGMNVLNVLDRAEAGFEGAQILTLEEQSNTYSSIRRAKSIRYFNERLYLMNIGYNSKDVDGEVTFVDPLDAAHPTIQNLGKPGHKHVYNAAMYKSNMRGEKTGFAVVLFDKDNVASYATKVPGFENFEFPNRREPASTDTIDDSYKGLVYAADTNGDVGYTHEVFDHYDAVNKTGQYESGDVSGAGPFLYSGDPLRYNYIEPSGLIDLRYDNGAVISDINGDGIENQQTMHPTSQNDPVSDLNKSVNKKVSAFSADPLFDTYEDYLPKMFGLDYYTQGLALKGLDSYPDWADGFSVVQTDPARRVVAQGLGFYALKPAESIFGTDTQKDVDKFWSYFPDLEHLYPDVAEDLISNPSSYKIQLVSPLGYASEVYNHFPDITGIRKGTDLITYARVLREPVSGDLIDGAINPFIGPDSGIPDPSDPNYVYVAYGQFTNNTTPGAFPSNQWGNGAGVIDATFDISSVSDVTTNSTRQSYFLIDLFASAGNEIYTQAGMNGAPNVGNDATNAGVMEWREPFYIINLIKEVDINPGITTQYRYTGNYVKFKSLVLESNGSANQSSVLVSERWEDCIPQISGQTNGLGVYGAIKRFVYVVGPDDIEKRWMNVTFESAGNLATIATALLSFGVYNDPVITNGFDIYGIYTSTETSGDSDGVSRVFTLVFNSLFPALSIPPAGHKVYVKYDNRIPVRVFGGDTYINESIWAPIDNTYANNGEPSSTDGGWVYPDNEFRMNAPFPLKSYRYVDTYPIWQNSDYLNNAVITLDNNFNNANLGSFFQFCGPLGADSAWIRQLITMWTAETRINLSFAFNLEAPEKAVSDQFFPLLNYIPRPYKWNLSDPADRPTFESDNHLRTKYYDEFGFEWNLWTYGGFRFLPQVNIDYSKSQTTEFITSAPTVGFEEQTDYCTRIVWSQKRPINIQNTPSVKTFLAQNYFDISDDTGEIKFAWSALSSDKGNNLYAMTDGGVCLLLVDKRLIYEINASELATVGSNVGGILNQLWIDRTIGMHDETWRSWAEYSNMLFFNNGIAAYMFSDNQLVDIARTGFFELYNRRFVPLIGEGYENKMSGGFNVLTREYIMNVCERQKGEDVPLFSSLIYGVNQQSLQCQSTYNYDKYLYYKNHLFGMKRGRTYELGIGNQIDGKDMECYVTGLSNAVVVVDKEFIRIRVNSNSKPEQVYFYKSYEDYKNDNYDSIVDTTVTPLAMKDYFGYECYIPRSFYPPHERNQGRVVIFKIVSSQDEEFLVATTALQYKQLK
jgi:hypothetical protein